MGKWWSLLFGGVMAACLLLFIVAPLVDWWMPEGVSSHAWRVDRLFYIILAITGFFFVLTEAILVVFMWQYAAPQEKAHVFGHHAMEEKVYWTSFFKRAFRPVSALLHDQHRVELAWTLVPALILLYIAFVQVSTWADVKYASRVWNDRQRETAPKFDDKQIVHQVAIVARQFEWRMRYPSLQRMKKWLEDKDNPETQKDFASFARHPQFDDIHLVNELHVWNEQPALVQLSTLDVIHSFNLPHMRVKQDALPGKTIPVWFTPIKVNTIKVTTKHNARTEHWEDGYNPKTKERGDKRHVWDIACAELCGWGHYRMIGRIYVHESRDDFLEWLKTAEQENQKGKVASAK